MYGLLLAPLLLYHMHATQPSSVIRACALDSALPHPPPSPFPWMHVVWLPLCARAHVPYRCCTAAVPRCCQAVVQAPLEQLPRGCGPGAHGPGKGRGHERRPRARAKDGAGRRSRAGVFGRARRGGRRRRHSQPGVPPGLPSGAAGRPAKPRVRAAACGLWVGGACGRPVSLDAAAPLIHMWHVARIQDRAISNRSFYRSCAAAVLLLW